MRWNVMNKIIGKRTAERVWFFIKPLIVTSVALSLTSVLVYDISSLSVFAPMKKSVDFRFSDLYNTVLDSRPQSVVSSDVVVVGVDGCDRHDLAQLLDLINYMEPASVSLDIFMPSETIYDEEVVEAIRDCDNLVLPYSLLFDDTDSQFSRNMTSFFDGEMEEKCYGVVNLSISSTKDVVREFKPYFEVGEKRIAAFMVATATLSAPDKVKVLQERNEESEIIYYPSVQFEILEAAELIGENADLNTLQEILRGKNILIGKVEDGRDCHMTPTDAAMPGILIHAHILDTILNERYISEVPKTINWIVAVLTCYLFMLATMYISRRMSRISSVVTRLFQFMFMGLVGYIGCMWFQYANQYVDFSLALLLVAIRSIATDVWGALVLSATKVWAVIGKGIRLVYRKYYI